MDFGTDGKPIPLGDVLKEIENLAGIPIRLRDAGKDAENSPVQLEFTRAGEVYWPRISSSKIAGDWLRPFDRVQVKRTSSQRVVGTKTVTLCRFFQPT